ncbi:MAG TPA: radical SAM protein [Gemmatimonadales bacterium]|nr:radical SAM protein [Gemmatimonadales bacterium]
MGMPDPVPRAPGWEPAYLERYRSGELARRVERALASLRSCRVCPRDCDVDRLADRYAFCKTGRHAVVSSYFPHFGEEDCLRGWNGSGTIFFSHCNLRCVFCQNYDISQAARVSESRGTPPERLAAMMLELQARGCHNINLVTPEHVVPQALEALLLAARGGLRLPLVYNTSAYDSADSLELLDGVVDIYMPDFKYWKPESAGRYLKAPDYPEVARARIKEMHRQVGDLRVDEEGLAYRGLNLRHLVMPGALDETEAILRWVARELGPTTYVNLMDQYYPAGRVSREHYPEINRRLTQEEFLEARRLARSLGLTRLDERAPHRLLRRIGPATVAMT